MSATGPSGGGPSRRRHASAYGGGRRRLRHDVRRARRGRRRAGLLVLAVVVLGAGAAAAFGGWALWRHVDRGYVFTAPARGGEVTVTIPEGASLGQIGEILEERRVVPRAGPFVDRAEGDGYSRSFRPGTYTLHEFDSYKAIVDELVNGTGPASVRLTIPEGYDAEDIALKAAEVVPGFSADDYRELTTAAPLPFRLEGMQTGTRLEGLLFPAAYDFPPLENARQLVELQLVTFEKQFAKVDLTRATAADLTPYDVVIIASMIEREVRVPRERALVAAVIWNRLRKGMPLQIDATIEYALGGHKEQLTLDDLKVESPYNTYLNPGLPPTPICSPGLAALKAAADPADVDYLYYVVRNDGTGRHAFSSDYQQFLKDKAAAGL